MKSNQREWMSEWVSECIVSSGDNVRSGSAWLVKNNFHKWKKKCVQTVFFQWTNNSIQYSNNSFWIKLNFIVFDYFLIFFLDKYIIYMYISIIFIIVMQLCYSKLKCITLSDILDVWITIMKKPIGKIVVAEVRSSAFKSPVYISVTVAQCSQCTVFEVNYVL